MNKKYNNNFVCVGQAHKQPKHSSSLCVGQAYK